MPRIRNWKDLVFFRPDKETKYRVLAAMEREKGKKDPLSLASEHRAA
jgi:hypothetical protein